MNDHKKLIIKNQSDKLVEGWEPSMQAGVGSEGWESRAMRDGLWSRPWQNKIQCLLQHRHLRFSSGITSNGAKFTPLLLLP